MARTPRESSRAQPVNAGPVRIRQRGAARAPHDVSRSPSAKPARGGRSAEVTRRTKETDISLTLAIDGAGRYEVETGVPFLNHMLELFTRHGFFDLTVRASGDVEVDDHHTVEDVGLTLGQAFREALGAKEGIRRFGEATVPLDEALVSVVVDLSGRPFLAYDLATKQTRIGSFDIELIHDFLLALVNQLGMNLHVRMLAGRNPHHIIEASFKGLARALDLATQRDPRVVGVLSTKGTL
jgi:imidazoleglycerol-phosphate dehydratase